MCVCVFVADFFCTFFFLIPGEALYTHWVQRHAALALLFAFYSWLSWQAWCHPGSGAAGKCILILSACLMCNLGHHTVRRHPLWPSPSVNFSVLTTQLTSEEGQRPGRGDGMGGEGKGGWSNKLHTGFFFFWKSSAARLSGACRDTSGKWGRRGQCKGQHRAGGGGVSMEGVGSGPGLQTDSWIGIKKGRGLGRLQDKESQC